MPDFNQLINSFAATMPDLVDAFWLGGKYAIAIFILLGIIYFL